MKYATMTTALLSCKLDRSELGHLEALAGRLQVYEDFEKVRTLQSEYVMTENITIAIRYVTLRVRYNTVYFIIVFCMVQCVV